MTILILAEHDGVQLNPSVPNKLLPRRKFGMQLFTFWLLGMAQILLQSRRHLFMVLSASFKQMLHHFEKPIAEDIANLMVYPSAKNYTVILAAHSSFSKNTLPRVAALLDVAMISDVLEIKANNTYIRSIYAGNVLTTIQSSRCCTGANRA